MPKNCCVSFCTKKVYVERGAKISYFRFPKDKKLFDNWICAIRRDVGEAFQVNDNTRICSRHFKQSDFTTSLTGIHALAEQAVPSIFEWSKDAAKKRKSPIKRHTASVVAASKSKKIKSILDSDEPEQTAEPSRSQELESDEENNELDVLKKRIEQLTGECSVLEKRVFSFLRFSNNEKSFKYYTGFPSVKVFDALFEFCNPGENGQNISYWNSSVTTEALFSDLEPKTKQGRPRTLHPKDELFITLCRLRQGFGEEHLAHLYGVSQSTISRIVITWINFLCLKLKDVPMWPSRELVDQFMPQDFKEKFPSTRVIIDCTEIKCQMPSSLLLNSELFSSYKNHATLKCLVGITPGGAFSFVSQLYTGLISDREIVTRSGFLDQTLDQGDSIMADKGFTIEDLLPPGVHLNIPPFLSDQVQMSAEDVVKTQNIASLRIHVERTINKVKNFRIWDGIVPLSLFGIVNQMWTVCAVLCNMQKPIISVIN